MKVLKKLTCLKCKKTKTEKHYKAMPNGRLNPKAIEITKNRLYGTGTR